LKTVFMFPGQGAQQVGMGRSLAEKSTEIARLYKRAGEIVGYDLADICFNGPEEKLNATEISQPGIFMVSVASLMALRAEPSLADIKPEIYAGLSLGEYTALYAAGVLDFEEGLKLVQIRGRSMQQAAEASAGAMVSILGMDQEQVKGLCQKVLEESPSEKDGQEPVLVPVNYNCPGQIVISGTINACNRAAELAPGLGAMKAIVLKVNGAFHTSMMAPAAEKLGRAIKACRFGKFKCPVVANVDAKIYETVESIPGKLLQQLVSPVQWQQSVEYLLEEGFERFVEVGPGRVLVGLVKKTARSKERKVTLLNVNEMV
jgi:[acyl-carrier-protein] S-malonyltransferase